MGKSIELVGQQLSLHLVHKNGTKTVNYIVKMALRLNIRMDFLYGKCITEKEFTARYKRKKALAITMFIISKLADWVFFVADPRADSPLDFREIFPLSQSEGII